MILLTCSICRESVQPTPFGWTRGNNASPVNEGRCCDDCNWTVVLPTRLRLAQNKGQHQ